MKPRALLYALPLLLFAPDALAWGLQTHLFLANYAVFALPFADPRLRAAAARFPRLVLAGACLPDLALTGSLIGTPAFRRAHRWATLRRLAAVPRDDADRALALGYASHLVTDVIAHNDFVPEHESRIARLGIAVHAAAEWAMDHYLRPRLPADPADVLAEDRGLVADFTARAFRCEARVASGALRMLERGEKLLRGSPLPGFCSFILRTAEQRLDDYLDRAKANLHLVEHALDGRMVDWEDSDPEGRDREAAARRDAGQHVARIVQAQDHP